MELDSDEYERDDSDPDYEDHYHMVDDGGCVRIVRYTPEFQTAMRRCHKIKAKFEGIVDFQDAIGEHWARDYTNAFNEQDWATFKSLAIKFHHALTSLDNVRACYPYYRNLKLAWAESIDVVAIKRRKWWCVP
jgi:hypothetical protein